jgi:hypothetical protein
MEIKAKAIFKIAEFLRNQIISLVFFQKAIKWMNKAIIKQIFKEKTKQVFRIVFSMKIILVIPRILKTKRDLVSFKREMLKVIVQ